MINLTLAELNTADNMDDSPVTIKRYSMFTHIHTHTFSED